MALPALRTRRQAPRVALDRAVVREVEQQKLLSTRICDLELHPEGVLAECIEQVTSELRARGVTFSPTYYLGDDDFWTSDRAISVNVPWYLANAELWQLVNDHLFEYSRPEVLMYLRHETGHAINYAFELWRRKDWVHTFRGFRRPYRHGLLESCRKRGPRARGGKAGAMGKTQSAQSAARFIQQRQRVLVSKLSGWIGNSDRRVIGKFLRQLQALCTYEHLVVPDNRRNEKLVDLTIVATWHVVDGIHRLSG